MDDYVLFRKHSPTRQGDGLALYESKQLECIVLNPGGVMMDLELTKKS